MFRNYLAAALRSLARNRFYSAISIVGLAIGLAAALLAGLIVRNELSYDRFIPGYERTYLAGAVLIPTGHPPLYDWTTPRWVASSMKLRFSEVEAVTRIATQDVQLRHGQVEAKEKIYWADPNVFDLLPLPSIAGDLRTALLRPDTIVLTRGTARKYFGRDTPTGESILLDGQHLMTVAAVIEDLPDHGTQLESGIFASGLASYSYWTQTDNDPVQSLQSSAVMLAGRTYFRLAPHASIERLRALMPDFIANLFAGMPPGVRGSLELVRLDKAHLSANLNPGIGSRLAMITVVGLLILFIACINFVNLTTARAARRSQEVGIRKVSGAGRSALIVQFLGESLIYAFLAGALALMLTELALPQINAFLNTGALLDYQRQPAIMAWIAFGLFMIGVLAGAYPAFVLSAFRPVTAFRGTAAAPGGARLRQALVTLQFAILIGLVIAAAVVYEQRIYATHDALRVNTEQMLIIRSPCNQALKDELRALPGVRGAFCSDQTLLTRAAFGNYHLKDGSVLAVDTPTVEPGVLSLYGLKPVAGRFSLANGDRSSEPANKFVINETAVRRLGFSSPEAAIGQPLPLNNGAFPGEIIGVVPDFAINAVDQEIRPAVYPSPERPFYSLIHVKLSGKDLPETLAAIDRLWTATGASEPINRFFLSGYIQQLYESVLRQAQVFGFCAGVAVLLACFGLAGLSASMAERRTKEIGIRKAMGAGTSDIVRMLLWQFTRPVIGAAIIAWIVAAPLMNHWLERFAYHTDLNPWIFLTSAAMALAIAMLVVSAHCYAVARAKPVTALRYE